MSQTSDPSQSVPPQTSDTDQRYWSDRLGRIAWRQGTRFKQVGRMDRRMARLAANTPARVWRRIGQLEERIDALCAAQSTASARQRDNLVPLHDEAALRSEYDHLSALIGRVTQIDIQIEALRKRLPKVWGARLTGSGTGRAELLAHLLRQKARVAQIGRALRLQHVELSAHLIEFR